MKHLTHIVAVIVTTALAILINSCEKKQTISDIYVGEWEGTVYNLFTVDDRQAASVVNLLELNIDVYGSYTCSIFDHADITGVPIKVGEGSTSEGYISEGKATISFSNTFNATVFSVEMYGNDLILRSSDLMIVLSDR